MSLPGQRSVLVLPLLVEVEVEVEVERRRRVGGRAPGVEGPIRNHILRSPPRRPSPLGKRIPTVAPPAPVGKPKVSPSR